LTDFHNSFADIKCVATLPCEMLKTEKLAVIWIKYLV